MIKAAAIKYPNGNIYTGKYHGKCFEAAHDAGEDIDRGQVKQGFITDKGDFLDRRHAAMEAMACNQIATLCYSKTELFSEDLVRL